MKSTIQSNLEYFFDQIKNLVGDYDISFSILFTLAAILTIFALIRIVGRSKKLYQIRLHELAIVTVAVFDSFTETYIDEDHDSLKALIKKYSLEINKEYKEIYLRIPTIDLHENISNLTIHILQYKDELKNQKKSLLWKIKKITRL